MTTKKLTNKQRLFEIGRALLTVKEPEIVEKLNTYIYDVSNVYTDGKVAQIEISDERGNKIIYQFNTKFISNFYRRKKVI